MENTFISQKAKVQRSNPIAVKPYFPSPAKVACWLGCFGLSLPQSGRRPGFCTRCTCDQPLGWNSDQSKKYIFLAQVVENQGDPKKAKTKRGTHSGEVLWMSRIQFAPPKTPWETIVCWYLQGIRKSQDFLGGAGFRPSTVLLQICLSRQLKQHHHSPLTVLPKSASLGFVVWSPPGLKSPNHQSKDCCV